MIGKVISAEVVQRYESRLQPQLWFLFALEMELGMSKLFWVSRFNSTSKSSELELGVSLLGSNRTLLSLPHQDITLEGGL